MNTQNVTELLQTIQSGSPGTNATELSQTIQLGSSGTNPAVLCTMQTSSMLQSFHSYHIIVDSCLFSVGPSIVISPKTRTVKETSSVSLTCDASGIPNPTIEWTKVGESQVLFWGRTYTIVNISRVAGNTLQYQCTASNGVERPVYDRANITVQCEY